MLYNGAPLYFERGSWGTAGCLVTRLQDCQPFILTAGHCARLAPDNSRNKTPMEQGYAAHDMDAGLIPYSGEWRKNQRVMLSQARTGTILYNIGWSKVRHVSGKEHYLQITRYATVDTIDGDVVVLKPTRSDVDKGLDIESVSEGGRSGSLWYNGQGFAVALHVRGEAGSGLDKERGEAILLGSVLSTLQCIL